MGRGQDEAAALEHDINVILVMSRCRKANGIQLRCELVVPNFAPFYVDTHHTLSKEECQGVMRLRLVQ